MSEEPPVKPKFQSSVIFLHFDQYLGKPSILGGGCSEAGGDELDKAQARDIKSKEQKIRSLEMDAYMAGKQAELEKAKREIAAATGTPQGTAVAPAAVHLDATMLEALAKMPDDQRDLS